jgi:hypothetical protein
MNKYEKVRSEIEDEYLAQIQLLTSKSEYNRLTKTRAMTLYDAKRNYAARLEALSEMTVQESDLDKRIAQAKASLSTS